MPRAPGRLVWSRDRSWAVPTTSSGSPWKPIMQSRAEWRFCCGEMVGTAACLSLRAGTGHERRGADHLKAAPPCPGPENWGPGPYGHAQKEAESCGYSHPHHHCCYVGYRVLCGSQSPLYPILCDFSKHLSTILNVILE